MVIKSEQLLETVMDLERSRQREHEIRMESEALLKGLRAMGGAHSQNELFQALVSSLRNVIDFEQAFILQADDQGKMTVLATTFAACKNSIWTKESMFKKILAGKPVAAFDISLVPEWQNQPESVTKTIRSALHIGLKGSALNAMLVITHSAARHFGPNQVKKALRFSPLATQALLTLELQKALRERDRFYQLSIDAMAIFTSQGDIIQHNQGWIAAFGENKQRYGNIFSLLHPEEAKPFHSSIAALNAQHKKCLVRTRLRIKSGGYNWFSCSIAVYSDQMIYYIVARDITDSVLFERKLVYQAGHDALTGLKNRAEFIESLEEVFIEHRKTPQNLFALFFLDLNKFKEINDTLGHDIGDELLKAFSNTLKESVRSEDVVSRLGGDEFTIILKHVNSIKDIETVAHRIRRKCATPYELKEHRIQVSSSIGIATSASGFKNGEDMLHAADLAMYTAKQDKAQPFCIHQDTIPP
nr:sensor domain-containing diguanylate cyclase [uncultured Desulfobacter sp.]